MSERVDRIAESPTLAVTSRARAMRAAGRPVIGFGAGEPDFATPEHIVEAAAKACSDPAMHRYTPAGGLPELRTAIAEKTARDSGLEVSEDQVVVTNGGKQALFEVFQTLIDPGDEVLLPSPYWVSYPEQIRLAGGEVTVVSTSASSGFRVDLAQLEAARTPRTRALVFVSPSNPTGAVYPPDEVAAIGRWAAEHGIWVVTDEIYQHLVYGDTRFASVPVEAPETVERCVVVGGVSKTYAMTGWRVGWLIAPPAVTAGVNRLQSHLTSNVANVAQAAALAAVTGPQDEVERMRVAFDRRRRLAVERLDAARGVTCIEPQGAFYTFPSFEQVLGTTVAGRRVDTTLELAEALLEVAEIALVPGEAFGAPGYARLSYALGDEDLAEGLQRLHRALDAS